MQCFIAVGIYVLGFTHDQFFGYNSLSLSVILAATVVQAACVVFLTFLISCFENFIQNNCYTFILWRQDLIGKFSPSP